jgi:pyruvate-ferredoxin/flavodoxin oxidoreductase
MVKACEERLHGWRVLQELAGLVTPFTDRIELEAQEKVAAARAAELAALKAEYEARIADLQKEVLEETRVEVRERLMALAGYTARGASGNRGAETQ